MDRLEAQVRRGEEAERLLSSPMLNAAFDDTLAAIQATWIGLNRSEKGFDERQLELHMMAKVIGRVRHCITQHVATGKLAQREIEGRKKLFRR